MLDPELVVFRLIMLRGAPLPVGLGPVGLGPVGLGPAGFGPAGFGPAL